MIDNETVIATLQSARNLIHSWHHKFVNSIHLSASEREQSFMAMEAADYAIEELQKKPTLSAEYLQYPIMTGYYRGVMGALIGRHAWLQAMYSPAGPAAPTTEQLASAGRDLWLAIKMIETEEMKSENTKPFEFPRSPG